MVGLCVKMGASAVNKRVNVKIKNSMRETKHYEIRRFRTECFTKWGNIPSEVGKQNQEEPQLDHGQEPQQPSIDEIWEWLGHPE